MSIEKSIHCSIARDGGFEDLFEPIIFISFMHLKINSITL